MERKSDAGDHSRSKYPNFDILCVFRQRGLKRETLWRNHYGGEALPSLHTGILRSEGNEVHQVVLLWHLCTGV